MRGVGAIFVVLQHGNALFGMASPPSAYLGVDFFFVLSGFIVAHVYAAQLQNGLPVRAFLRSRLLRLYPVYLLGTLSGVAVAAESLLVGHSDGLWNYTQPLISLIFALFLLPSPASDAMFPLDIPAWSLFLEFVVNIAFAIRWLRTTRALLALMVVAGTVLVVASMATNTLNFGWSKETSLLGAARIFFSFPLGVFVYRLHQSLPSIRMPGWFFAVPVLLLAVLVYANPTGPARIGFDLLFLAVISPALVLAGAACDPASARVRQAFIALGAMSYPLYTLHYPSLMALMGSISRHVPAGAATTIASVAMLVGMVVAGWYVANLDARFRAHLNRRRRLSPRAGVWIRREAK